MELVEPERFEKIFHLHTKLLKFWYPQLAYVVENDILEEDYGILAGHNFMRFYGIKLLPHKGDIER